MGVGYYKQLVQWSKGEYANANNTQDDIVIIPLRTLQRRMAGNDDVRAIIVSVADGVSTETVQNRIEALMRERRGITGDKEDDFHVRDMKAIIDTLTGTTTVLTALLSAVAGVSLLVGGIGIMNIMLVSVTERTREIGIRLAIGAQERQVLMQFLHITAYALDGFAFAAEALVGKAVGQRRRDVLERSVTLCLRWSLIFAAGFSAAYFLLGPHLINALTDLPEVRETTLRYLPWMIVSPLVSVWSFLYDGVYVGATRAREMRDIMLFSTFAVFLPGWEDGLFPSQRSMDETGMKGLEEERRLAYVGITRAQEELTMSYCSTRVRWGETVRCQESSFLAELDDAHLEWTSYDDIMGAEVDEQQVLDGHELVLLFAGALERLVQGEFQLFAQHGRRTCHCAGTAGSL